MTTHEYNAITEILEDAAGLRASAARPYSSYSLSTRYAAQYAANAEGLELAAVLLLKRWAPEVLTRHRPATYARDAVFAYLAVNLPVPKAARLAAHKAWLRERGRGGVAA